MLAGSACVGSLRHAAMVLRAVCAHNNFGTVIRVCLCTTSIAVTWHHLRGASVLSALEVHLVLCHNTPTGGLFCRVVPMRWRSQ